MLFFRMAIPHLWHFVAEESRWKGSLGARAVRIVALLEAGANPLALHPSSHWSLIRCARMQLQEDPENPHWRLIVEKIEEKIAAVEQE